VSANARKAFIGNSEFEIVNKTNPNISKLHTFIGFSIFIPEEIMSNGELHAREREDLSLHVERCAERYTAVRAEICGLRKQTRRIEGAIWGIVAVLVALGAGGAQILPILHALARGAGG
jgi:hypothetical protein